MLETIAHSAAFGFGGSFGRDIYKGLKKGNLILLALVSIALVTFGYRELIRGHDRGVFGTLFVTVIGSLIMIALGTMGLFGVAMMFSSSGPAPAMTFALGGHVLFAAIGIIWGLSSRAKRRKRLAIEAANVAFMHENGLRDSPFDSDVIEDDDGYKLRLKEQRDDGIVFSVIGKRGMRALISLENGRMTEYSGVVKL